MEPATRRPNNLRSNVLLVRVLSFGLLLLLFLAPFAYTITLNINNSAGVQISGDQESRLRDYYSSVFQDLITEGFLSPESKSLCLETLTGEDVLALKQIGVADSVGVYYNRSGRLPFYNNTFDFEFSGMYRSAEPVQFASEVSRTLKPGGFFVIHTAAKDDYSLNSLLDLFNFCKLIRYRDIDGINPSTPSIREVVLMKENGILSVTGNSDNKCSVPGYKRELIRNAEPLIQKEPLKPWISLRRNVRYLPSMVDISFKNRYVYIDVGARNYGSSIGSWFKKQYPKQNKNFHVYAIEADKAFHEEYRTKKRVTLLPYAAWVRNETLFFEISRELTRTNEERGRGMGRVQAARSSSSFVGDSDKIEGFDFAVWLKKTVSERDFVVVKMDVEGSEFYLVPRLVETGAICLIDELFIECHYNRLQRCCPGKRSPKFQKTYKQCLDLFSSLRESGVLVHQWW
ncbi:hypothetical protein Vadar_021617 [Vaccinium darrowii]|uniref:Uncharacterized protein n=1 Tax=Vaccinium darrowii TaxID=229202 RepID=A0ACB7XC05_9ERIC|nr:hypothetical protein Vadar_021617 [Vaccinium darrowii]